MNPFERMIAEGNEPTIQNLLSAMCKLKEPEQIREFVKGYEDWLIANGEPSIKGKEVEIARKNIGYILGYLSSKERTRLYAALPSISHPVFGAGFGRGNDPTPEQAFKAGQDMVRK